MQLNIVGTQSGTCTTRISNMNNQKHNVSCFAPYNYTENIKQHEKL